MNTGASPYNFRMRRRRSTRATTAVITCLFAQASLALVPSIPAASRNSRASPSVTFLALKKQAQPTSFTLKKTVLTSSVTEEETDQQQLAAEVDAVPNQGKSHATIISSHLHEASTAQSNNDMAAQQTEMECAERALVRWVEEHRSRSSTSGEAMEEVQQGGGMVVPDTQIFSHVIGGLLALPSSFEIGADGENEEQSSNGNEQMEDIRKTVLGKGRTQQQQLFSGSQTNTNSDRATHILDLMESFHEPTGALYDTVIASHGADALAYLFCPIENDEDKGYEGEVQCITGEEYYQQAWKSAKSALQLLNRSEELYHETGQSSSRLPAISSYVTAMDVWKALAVGAEDQETGEKKLRDEALEVVRNLRQRRLKVYTLDNSDAENAGMDTLLPEVSASTEVGEVLESAISLLCDNEPEYQLKIEDPAKIGTWHFNQLIFDLAKYPQPFSGPLAQELLDYMVLMVKKVSRQTRSKKKKESVNVPKPNSESINGVLKAWMVTPDYSNVAQHAEAVLAKLAAWQSEGILWGVSADTVSYNTCINIWKDSGASGAAQRATDILRLMENESTIITPDVISYSTCIGAWADCAESDSRAGRFAEEILMRMYNRNKEAGGDKSVRPTTRCFNAVLLAYANGKQSGGGKRALELLRFMERLHSEGYADLSPDTYTFNIVMKALANCGERGASQKAILLLERMEHSYNKGDTGLKPDLPSYNTVLDAFSKEGDARSAERLLAQMRHGKDELTMPDAHSYTAVLTAWSKSDDKAKSVTKAEELFNEIEGRYAAGDTDFRAETSVYNALINCWAKSGDREALHRVTQILSLMEELGFKGGDSDVQPNSRTYCSVLDTLAKSKNFKAYDKSLDLLQRMEDLYNDGYDSVRPCTRAYSIVLSTIARSRRKSKAIEAQDLLHRMESEYRGGNSACRPNVYSYNAVLNAAAFSGRDEIEQEEAFRVACLTFDELRMSDYLQPTHISYGTFLKAIKHLMPESDVRNDLVKGLFRKCCRDGLVSEFVLKETADLSTPGLYQSLLEGVTNDFGNLPKSWSANVSERDGIKR